MLAPALGLRTPYMGKGSSALHAQTHEMIQGQLLVLPLHASCVLGVHRFYGCLHGYGKADTKWPHLGSTDSSSALIHR